MKAFLLACCLAAPAWSVELIDLTDVLIQCEHVRILEEASPTKRARLIRSCAGSCSKERARALAALTLVQEGRIERAISMFQQAEANLASGSDDWFLHQLVLVLLDEGDKALLSLDDLLTRGDLEPKAELIASILSAWTKLRAGDSTGCEAALRFVEGRLRMLEEASDPPVSTMDTIRRHLDELRRLIRISEQGPGPVLYAKAQSQRRSGAYAESIKTYSRLIELATAPGGSREFVQAKAEVVHGRSGQAGTHN